jgi:acetylornithine deacetylase/succinyl-diaminopimelate desuccinylase-like protein
MMMRQLSILAAGLVLGAAATAALAKAPATPARASAAAAERAEAREIFEHIVGIESSVGNGNVPAVAQYLAQRFLAGGFPAADVRILPLGETASLVVRYRGSGRGGRPIDLIAHMDVVTANRADWQRDPFRLIEENGYFFGRGTADVKQEVALITTTFLALKARG